MTKPKRIKTATLSLRLHPDLKRQAEAAAAADQRTLTSLIEKLLSDYVRDHPKRR